MLRTLPPPTDRRFDVHPQFATDIDCMERRLREDERRVRQQRRIVHVLRARGADSMLAEELLQTFEDLLAHRRILAARLKS